MISIVYITYFSFALELFRRSFFFYPFLWFPLYSLLNLFSHKVVPPRRYLLMPSIGMRATFSCNTWLQYRSPHSTQSFFFLFTRYGHAAIKIILRPSASLDESGNRFLRRCQVLEEKIPALLKELFSGTIEMISYFCLRLEDRSESEWKFMPCLWLKGLKIKIKYSTRFL